MGAAALPHDLILKLVFPEYLIEHDLDVVRGVPIAVIVKAAGLFQDAHQFDAARAHEFNVSLRRFVPIIERALLLRLAPEHFVISIRVERWIDVDQIDARIG